MVDVVVEEAQTVERIQKTIAEVMAPSPPILVGPSEDAARAAALMAEHHSAAVLVVEDEALVGIFTERDFLNRIIAEGRSAASTPLREVMTTEPTTLQAGDCVSWGIHRMAVDRFRNVPIVDEAGRPVGLLAVRDVTAHLDEIFAEIERSGPPSTAFEAWVDVGGGD